jgi:hypothetical protein
VPPGQLPERGCRVFKGNGCIRRDIVDGPSLGGLVAPAGQLPERGPEEMDVST